MIDPSFAAPASSPPPSYSQIPLPIFNPFHQDSHGGVTCIGEIRESRCIRRALEDYTRSSNPSRWGLYRHGRLLDPYELEHPPDLESDSFIGLSKWTLELFVPLPMFFVLGSPLAVTMII